MINDLASPVTQHCLPTPEYRCLLFQFEAYPKPPSKHCKLHSRAHLASIPLQQTARFHTATGTRVSLLSLRTKRPINVLEESQTVMPAILLNMRLEVQMKVKMLSMYIKNYKIDKMLKLFNIKSQVQKLKQLVDLLLYMSHK